MTAQPIEIRDTATPESYALGQVFKAFRLLLKLGQRGLGRELGLSDVYVSQIENGHRACCMRTLEIYSTFLGFRMSTLLYLAEQVVARTSSTKIDVSGLAARIDRVEGSGSFARWARRRVRGRK
jgi:transcriptional regulator with XRE-family HTH domain